MSENEIFKLVVSELDFLGDILSIGITKKAIKNMGKTPENVTIADMLQALDGHIQKALVSFVGPSKARKKVMEIKKKLKRMEVMG